MADDTDRDGDTIIWFRKCQLKLQQPRHWSALHRRVDRDTSLADAEQYMRMLESEFCVVDSTCCFVFVDDGTRLAGATRRLKRRIVNKVWELHIWTRMIYVDTWFRELGLAYLPFSMHGVQIVNQENICPRSYFPAKSAWATHCLGAQLATLIVSSSIPGRLKTA